MNIINYDILNIMINNQYLNQRNLASLSGYSLGSVNKALGELKQEGYLTSELYISEKTKELVNTSKSRKAIILAAGMGLRMAPINLDTPKAFLEVNNEPLIERLIKQLNEVGIKEIYIVVGFKKEFFDYLIDKYNVKLIVNRDYAIKNNLYSLNKAIDNLSNCYIIPSDIWCFNNPFNKNEFYSWYMINEKYDENSTIRSNRSKQLVKSNGGNTMIGISYITEHDSIKLKNEISTLCNDSSNDNEFWETALFKNINSIYAKIVNSNDIVEINSYEQLRNLDSHSKQLQSKAINLAAKVLKTDTSNIADIKALKKGMTNRSFLFSCKDKKYIMRIPGEGTEKLINRKEEAEVYNLIKDKNICDNIIYINPENGYKISEFIENAVTCNPFNEKDVLECMQKLRNFHNLKLKVNHTFDLFSKINFYESLWNDTPSAYRDYKNTKSNVLSLKNFIEENKEPFSLTHIDAVPDNFLFSNNKKNINLIDWEYAAMQDPHVDLAMFAIYALYDRKHIDALIDAYFLEGCPKNTRIKIYCYISVCGLLWSNWCEYKSQLGVEFGEYSLKQYRFAKDYYKIAMEELKK